MVDSALGGREKRRLETTRTLIRIARRRAAQDGIGGFTIEELCDEAGLSRRTFFNYFASKDDAVLGMPLPPDDDEAVAAFLAGGTEGVNLSATLVTDLCALNEARWAAMGDEPATHADLAAAFDREPRLLTRLLQLAAQNEQRDVALVHAREHLAPGDLRAAAAVQTVNAIVRATAAEFTDPAVGEPFAVIFARRIRAARELWRTQSSPTNGTE